MCGGVNVNFATAVVNGALAMAGDSVDLEAVHDAVVSSSADFLPTGQDVRRSVHVVVNNWWRSFGYIYVLAAIRAKNEKEKRSSSNGFDDMGGVRGRTSDDSDQEERAEE
jgi:hypothetical protein